MREIAEATGVSLGTIHNLLARSTNVSETQPASAAISIDPQQVSGVRQTAD